MNFPVKWFSSDMPGAPILNGHPGAVISVLDACLIDGWGLLSVDNIAFDSGSGEATMTIVGGHGFVVDQVILISGANEAEFNGEQRVTWIDSTSVKFNPIHTPGVATASGTITAKVAPVGNWGKPFSSPDNLRAIYQSTSPNRLSEAGLYIDDSNTHQEPTRWDYNGVNAQMTAYGAFTDLETRTDPVNHQTNYQILRKCYTTSATYFDSPQRWIIIADERFVYFFVNHMTYADDDFMNAYYFGEIPAYKPNDNKAYLIEAGSATSTSSRSASYLPYMNERTSLFLQSDMSGINPSNYVGLYGLSFYGQYMGYNQTASFPGEADNGLYLTDKVYVLEGQGANKKPRGEMPGLGYPLHKESALPGRTIHTLPWRNGQSKVMAIRVPYSVNQNAGASYAKGQVFIDIEGSWRE